MKYFLNFILLLSLLPHSAFSEQNKNATTLAEFVFFTSQSHDNMMSWVEKLPLAKQNKNQVLAYLRGYNLEKSKIPEIDWQTGSSVLQVGPNFKLDLSDFEKKQITLNNQKITFKKNDRFEDIVKTIKAAKIKPVSVVSKLYSYIEPLAEAEPTALDEFMAGLFYWIGLDQISTCLNDQEAHSSSTCIFRSDASVLLKSLKYTFIDFECDDEKFRSAKFKSYFHSTTSSHLMEVRMDHEPNGKKTISTYQGGRQTCQATLENNKIVEIKSMTSVEGYCDGRTKKQYASSIYPLKPGDTPKIFGPIEIPFERLENCCASKECRKAMKSTNNSIESQTNPPASR